MVQKTDLYLFFLKGCPLFPPSLGPVSSSIRKLPMVWCVSLHPVYLSRGHSESLNPNWLDWNLRAGVPQAAGSDYFTASLYQHHAERPVWMMAHDGTHGGVDFFLSVYSFLLSASIEILGKFSLMTSWLLWKVGLRSFWPSAVCPSDLLPVCLPSFFYPPSFFLAEAPKLFGLLASKLLLSTLLARNWWDVLANMFQTSDITIIVAEQLQAGNK